MKFKKIILLSNAISLIPIASLAFSMNSIHDKNFEIALEKSNELLNRLYNEKQKYKFYTYIKDEEGNKYIYIQFEKRFIIYDLNLKKIIQITQSYHKKDIINKSIYVFGEDIKDPNLQDKESFKIDLNKDTFESIPNISNVIKNAWWWASRNTIEKIGYIQTRDFRPGESVGMCEYIALSNLLLYNELFTSSTIFTDEEFNKYFELSKGESDIFESSPVFRNYGLKNPKESLPYKLWKLNNEKLNLWEISSYYLPVTRFMVGKMGSFIFESDYKIGAYYWKTIEHIKNNNPVIVTTTKTMHSFVVYGYDEKSEMLLINWLWGGRRSITLLNYWKLSESASPLKLFYTLKTKPKNFPTNFRKVFHYNNEYFTGNEMTKIYENQRKI